MINIGQKSVELYEMLKSGKKVTTVSENGLKYNEDWNNPDSGCWSSTNTRLTPVLYFWCNPQMNRMIGRLADGREKDISLGFLDLYSHKFMEYIEEPKPNGWRDVFDAKRMMPKSWRECIHTAKDLKYNYICWNGRVFSTRDDYQAFPVCNEDEL
jgi:hypothetical protein